MGRYLELVFGPTVWIIDQWETTTSNPTGFFEGLFFFGPLIALTLLQGMSSTSDLVQGKSRFGTVPNVSFHRSHVLLPTFLGTP